MFRRVHPRKEFRSHGDACPCRPIRTGQRHQHQQYDDDQFDFDQHDDQPNFQFKRSNHQHRAAEQRKLVLESPA